MKKYIAKMPTSSGKMRYFYTPEELAGYKTHRKATAGKGEKGKKGKKNKGIRVLPKGHMATSAPGKILNGYRPGMQPDSMGNERWQELQRLWGTTYGGGRIRSNSPIGRSLKVKSTRRSKMYKVFRSSLLRR